MVESGGPPFRRAFVVQGRVQGVGFRWWTKRTADRLALVGSVRNRADGSVEASAAGAEAAVEEFERALHRGPPGARVERVTRVEGQDSSDVTGFTIWR